MNKKQKNIAMVLVFVALLVLLGVYGKDLFAVASGSYVNVPLYGYYECDEAVGNPVSTQAKAIPIPAQTVELRCIDNARSCELYVQANEPNFFSLSRRILYQRCTSSGCQQWQVQDAKSWTTKSGNIPTATLGYTDANSYWKVRYQKGLLGVWTDTTGASAYETHIPFILWKVSPTSGRKAYTNAEQGCKFPDSVKSSLINFVSSNDISTYSASLNKEIDLERGTGSSNYQLQFKETRGFVDIFVEASVENEKFQDGGYCTDKTIHPIVSIQTGTGTYKIVDTSSEGKAVTCCNGDIEPNVRKCVNGAWQSLATPKDDGKIPCNEFSTTTDYSIYGSKKLAQQVCVNGYMQTRYKSVECTRNSDCSSGDYCDISDYKCISVGTGSSVTNTGNGQQTTSCKSCTEWALRIFHKQENQCSVANTVETHWYAPWTYIGYTGYTTQNTVCPIYFLVIVLVGIVVLAFVFGITSVTYLIVRLFKRKGRKR